MKTPINDYSSWIDMESHAPEKVKKIAEKIRDLYHKLQLINHRHPESNLKYIFEAKSILTSVIGDFISLFQYAGERTKKGQDPTLRSIQTDLINLGNKIELKTEHLTLRPLEKIYPSHFFQIKEILSEPINSLIGASLISAWEESYNYQNKKCDEDKFYKTLFEETQKRAGQNPMFQVFKKPTRTMASPILTQADKKDLVLGLKKELDVNKDSKLLEDLKDLSIEEEEEGEEEEGEEETKQQSIYDVNDEDEGDDEELDEEETI